MNIFTSGCVIALFELATQTEKQKREDEIALKKLNFNVANELNGYATEDLLAREHHGIADLRARGIITPEDEGQDRQSKFRKANPLYGARIYSSFSIECLRRSADETLALLDEVFSKLNEIRMSSGNYGLFPSVKYIWLKGARSDIGMRPLPQLPSELEYTDEELDEMEYATGLEATAGWTDFY